MSLWNKPTSGASIDRLDAALMALSLAEDMLNGVGKSLPATHRKLSSIILNLLSSNKVSQKVSQTELKLVEDMIDSLFRDLRKVPFNKVMRQFKNSVPVFTDDTDSEGTSLKGVSAIPDAVDALVNGLPKNERIVLLGRDCWAFYPFLLDAGFDVRYFHWSRLQVGEPMTEQLWASEIGIGRKIIVDTGFSGTILNAIRGIDPDAQGILLSSAFPSVYPELMPGRRNDVLKIEELPKACARVLGYDPSGNGRVLAARQTHNQGDVAKALGLDPAWGEFTGLTPEQRSLRKASDIAKAVANAPKQTDLVHPVMTNKGLLYRGASLAYVQGPAAPDWILPLFRVLAEELEIIDRYVYFWVQYWLMF